MTRARVLAALLLASVLLSSCTLVPTSRTPSRISPAAVPLGLLGKTIPGTANGHVIFITQPVYIVDATGHLAPSSRIVPSPPTLSSVLRELILGPTDIEVGTGYTSALPNNLVVTQATIDKGVGIIDLTRSLASIPRQQLVLAVGQLTLTAFGVGAVRGIRITVNGVPEKLPLPNGKTAQLVTVADFQSLLNG
ncbi:MAG: GerMN domain-containing protein [Actinomycetales bacterium]|nr:GerMN domain-containing protein [Actinomycetales bacterium]